MKTAAFDNLVAQACNVRIEDEAARRGLRVDKRGDYAGPCPVCGGVDRFWVSKKKQRWGCRPKGCGRGGDVIDLVMHIDNCSLMEAVATLTNEKITRPQVNRDVKPEVDDVAKKKYAAEIWRDTVAAAGTPVETYLKSRSIMTPVPPRLRFARSTKHTPTSTYWPAMVGLVTRGTDDEPIAVHRTFLKTDGSGKAPVEPQKMTLGPTSGGAVRLADPTGDFLLVGEGIETCLAAVQATGLPTWVALSTSGLLRLDLPKSIRRVTILADGDEPGEKAALDAGARWKSEGREARIARPPHGEDFADVLKRASK